MGPRRRLREAPQQSLEWGTVELLFSTCCGDGVVFFKVYYIKLARARLRDEIVPLAVLSR